MIFVKELPLFLLFVTIFTHVSMKVFLLEEKPKSASFNINMSHRERWLSLAVLNSANFSIVDLFFRIGFPRFLISVSIICQVFCECFSTGAKIKTGNFPIFTTPEVRWLPLAGLVCTDFSVIEMFFKIVLPRFLVSVTIIFQDFLNVFRKEENGKPQTFHIYDAWRSLIVSSRTVL